MNKMHVEQNMTFLFYQILKDKRTANTSAGAEDEADCIEEAPLSTKPSSCQTINIRT